MKLQPGRPFSKAWTRRTSALIVAGILIALVSCARTGRLDYIAQPVAPVATPSAGAPITSPEVAPEPGPIPWVPLFGDTAIGLVPGTGDSTRRYLGSLRQGFTADTLNIILMGDNRPAFRTARLKPEYLKIKGMLSWNPINFLDGLIHIPILLVKGLIPDLALVRDIPDAIKATPSWGREESVVKAVMARIDSIEARDRSTRAFPISRLPGITNVPTHRKAWRIGARPPAFRSAEIVCTTASIPQTDGFDSWPSTPIQ